MSDLRRNAIAAAALPLLLAACGDGGDPDGSLFEPPTYTGQIAAILHENCAACHRPGESAPFDLLTYEDAAKRARQIVEVTGTRYMPPFLPDTNYRRYVGERRLSDEQIELLHRWHEAGAPRGDGEPPAPPAFAEGWQLGEPDLVVELPEAYELPADGADIYRNFVIPTGLAEPRFVRGMEFRPGHPKAVHHAFVLMDVERASRERDAADPGPGYGGMSAGDAAQSPGGHFVSWQPGKVPSFVPDGMSWRLPAGADLVVQLHMQTLGKPARVRPSVGLFFTDQPPERIPYKIVLTTDNIDIPPGERDYRVGTKYTLPVAVDVLAVIPHAHYLGKQLHGYAVLPDGRKEWLVRIDRWDFNWQGDYRLASPLHLPAGSVLYQEFSFDNSAANPLNPHDPPQRVTWGQNTTDEMAELWVQVLTASPAETEALNNHYAVYQMRKRQRQLLGRLQSDGDTAELRTELAKAALVLGDAAGAEAHLAAAIALDPDAAEPHYIAGRLQADTDPAAARGRFLAAVAREPEHFAALNGLGMLALRAGDLGGAQRRFEQAVAANPESSSAQGNLGLVYLRLGNKRLAAEALAKAAAIDPENPKWQELLAAARG